MTFTKVDPYEDALWSEAAAEDAIRLVIETTSIELGMSSSAPHWLRSENSVNHTMPRS